MDGRKNFSVAIDGPSGAGKSSVAKRAASSLGFIYVDTGAIYRTVGLAAYRRGFELSDEKNVSAMLPELKIELGYKNASQRMYLNGEDVSDDIRVPVISKYASGVSAMPAVRAFLLDMQRDMAKRSSVIMDGRDIGTVVLPDAGLKIFLTATAEERAGRRFKELQEKNVTCTFDEVLSDIVERDSRDSSRDAAPLKAADDAVFVDTTGKSFDESVEIITGLIKERFGL